MQLIIRGRRVYGMVYCLTEQVDTDDVNASIRGCTFNVFTIGQLCVDINMKRREKIPLGSDVDL